jgi:hypothetical protein
MTRVEVEEVFESFTGYVAPGRDIPATHAAGYYFSIYKQDGGQNPYPTRDDCRKIDADALAKWELFLQGVRFGLTECKACIADMRE